MDANEIVVHEVVEMAASWFASFFEKPFVKRVNLRIAIRMLRFCRSA